MLRMFCDRIPARVSGCFKGIETQSFCNSLSLIDYCGPARSAGTTLSYGMYDWLDGTLKT